MDAELLVFGVSHPHAHVTMQGEPVPVIVQPETTTVTRAESFSPLTSRGEA